MSAFAWLLAAMGAAFWPGFWPVFWPVFWAAFEEVASLRRLENIWPPGGRDTVRAPLAASGLAGGQGHVVCPVRNTLGTSWPPCSRIGGSDPIGWSVLVRSDYSPGLTFATVACRHRSDRSATEGPWRRAPARPRRRSRRGRRRPRSPSPGGRQGPRASAGPAAAGPSYPPGLLPAHPSPPDPSRSTPARARRRRCRRSGARRSSPRARRPSASASSRPRAAGRTGRRQRARAGAARRGRRGHTRPPGRTSRCAPSRSSTRSCADSGRGGGGGSSQEDDPRASTSSGWLSASHSSISEESVWRMVSPSHSIERVEVRASGERRARSAAACGRRR